MNNLPRLAPCMVGNGTLTNPRDMVRSLETLESVRYAYTVDGVAIAEGKATLVKLMSEGDSATMLVNGCLFLNVESFRYLTFNTCEEGACSFELVGDGASLTLRPVEDCEPVIDEKARLRLLAEIPYDVESVLMLDEDDDEE